VPDELAALLAEEAARQSLTPDELAARVLAEQPHPERCLRPGELSREPRGQHPTIYDEDDMSEVDTSLPGHDLVSEGLADLEAGRETPAGLLVTMASHRLRALGFDVPAPASSDPSHRLYELLAREGPDAHSRYNALVRRIVSFARAAEISSRR
jgi:hypothetical protein